MFPLKLSIEEKSDFCIKQKLFYTKFPSKLKAIHKQQKVILNTRLAEKEGRRERWPGGEEGREAVPRNTSVLMMVSAVSAAAAASPPLQTFV